MSVQPNTFSTSSPLFPLDIRFMNHFKKISENKCITRVHFNVKYTAQGREISTYFGKYYISYKYEEI